MANPLTKAFSNTLARLKSLIYPGGVVSAGRYPGDRVGLTALNFVPADRYGHTIRINDQPDEARAGDLWTNSAVAIALDWVVLNFPQADLKVEQRIPGPAGAAPEWEAIEDDPMVGLLSDPTPTLGAYDFHGLWAGALLSCLVDGNGYWLKARDGAGDVRELWWAPHYTMTPFRTDAMKAEYQYQYRVYIPGIAKPFVQIFEPSEVIHFKHGPPDPFDDLRACAPLKRCLREVASDNEVAAYTSSVLYNRGVPGLVAIFKDRHAINEDKADDFRRVLKRSFTGHNRGETAVLAGEVTLESPAFSPNDMNLNEISRIPEARICAALGIPPMLIGLNVGDTQKTYANIESASKHAWQRLSAIQNRMAEGLYRQLLPDFVEDRKALRVVWDYSRVEALQDDRNLTATRATLLYEKGVAKRAEARKMVGLEPAEDDSDDVYMTDVSTANAEKVAKAMPARTAGIAGQLPGKPGAKPGDQVGPDGQPIKPGDTPTDDANGQPPAKALLLVDSRGRRLSIEEVAQPLIETRQSEPHEVFARAAHILDRLARRLDEDDAGGGHGLAGQPLSEPVVGLQGDVPRSLCGQSGQAPGQPAWPARWAADQEGTREDLPGDGSGNQGLAGEPEPVGDPGVDPVA